MRDTIQPSAVTKRSAFTPAPNARAAFAKDRHQPKIVNRHA
ncbi:hypothetical protein [Bradyrhizobium sp. P5_C11_2]